MIGAIYFTAVVLCAAVVLVRVLCLVARIKRSAWPPVRHAIFSLSICSLGACAAATVLHVDIPSAAWLVSVAGMIAADRRTPR